MRFLMYTNDPTPPTPPSPELMAEIEKLIDDSTKSGVLVMTGGFDVTSTRVRSSAGKVTVLDGPFTETKELTGGYAIVDVASKEEAIAWAKRFRSIAGEGESVVQRLWAPEEGFPTPDGAGRSSGAR